MVHPRLHRVTASMTLCSILTSKSTKEGRIPASTNILTLLPLVTVVIWTLLIVYIIPGFVTCSSNKAKYLLLLIPPYS